MRTTKNGFSSLFVILVVILMAVAIGLVLWQTLGLSSIKTSIPFPGGKSPTIVDNQVKQLNTLSGTDEIADVEKDLNETTLDQIDEELSQVDESLSSF